ncbi:MAG: C39 family peptidase [Clostridia bacterium]|nr:C39 family peptidase [Clostridia bacterium]
MKKFLSVIIIMMLIISVLPISAYASETTANTTFTYLSSGSWKSFNGTVTNNNYMDCIKIQTPSSKSYYLQYRTYNEGKTAFYPYVTSIENDYAGVSGRRIQRLGIRVIDKATGSSVATRIVVMYRVLVNGIWLPWVSNADPEWMYFVQRKYGLKGVIDTASGYAGLSDGSFITGVEIRIFEETAVADSKGTQGVSKIIDAPFISQVSKYPTGCESVSAVMAMNYLGLDISVDNFIDKHLEMGPAANFDPNLCFGGNPRTSSGMGCYAPVIEKAAKSAAKGFGIAVTRTEGSTIASLCKNYIDKNIPVILWATQGMQTPRNGVKITYNGKTIQWIAPEHCLLLVGYNENNYIFNDPLKSKNYSYSRNAVENAYYGLGAQAVILSPISSDFTVKEKEFDSLPQGIPVTENLTLNNGSYKNEIPLLTLADGRKLEISALYSSAGLATGALGTGWYYNYEKKLIINGNNFHLYESPSKFSVYTLNSDGSYYDKNGYILSPVNEGGYCLNKNFEGYEYYDTNGRLYKITDKYGFDTVISYSANTVTVTDSATNQNINLTLDNNGRITSIISGNKTVTLKYTANVLTEIADSDQNRYSLRYDNALRLISVTGNYTQNITYGTDGRVTALNNIPVSYNGNTVTVDGTNEYTFNTSGAVIKFSGIDGTQSFIYDEGLNIISKTDKNGTTSYNYNDNGRTAVITDIYGGETYYFYDENQNLIKIIDPLKGDVNSNGIIEVTDFIRLKKYLGNNSNMTVSDYNSNLNESGIVANDLSLLKIVLLTESEKTTSITEYTYNERNQPISAIFPDGSTKHYTYDEYGNII